MMMRRWRNVMGGEGAKSPWEEDDEEEEGEDEEEEEEEDQIRRVGFAFLCKF